MAEWHVLGTYIILIMRRQARKLKSNKGKGNLLSFSFIHDTTRQWH